MNKILWTLAIVFGLSGNLVAETLDDGALYDKVLQQLLNELSMQYVPIEKLEEIRQIQLRLNKLLAQDIPPIEKLEKLEQIKLQLEQIQLELKELSAQNASAIDEKAKSPKTLDQISSQKSPTKSNDKKKKMDGGPFLGVGLGIGPQWEYSSNTSPTYSYQSTMLNLKAGYILQFNRFVGIRGYVSLDKDIENTQKSPEYGKLKQSLRMLTANLELMLQIPFKNNAIGVFSGLGYGHIKYSDNFFYYDGQANRYAGILPGGNRYSGPFPETTNGFSGTINVGVYLKIGNHMLELDIKRLPLQNTETTIYDYGGPYYGGKEKFYGILYNVAYSYKF